MPPAVRRRILGEQAEQTFEVWPENWRAFQFFGLVVTQWKRDAVGHLAGLDYPAVTSIFQTYRIPPRQRARLMSDVQLIEAGALQAAREKAESEKDGKNV